MGMNVRLVFLAAVALMGCNGNSFSGSVQGVKFSPSESVLMIGNDSGLQFGVVLMADRSGLCDLLKQSIVPRDATYLITTFAMTDAQGNPLPLNNGTYTVVSPSSSPSPGSLANVTLEKTDGSCSSVFDRSASSGSLKISSVSTSTGGHAAGTFDLFFDQDHATGSFNAPFCDVPVGSFTSASCM